MTSTLFRTVGLSLLLSQLALAQAGDVAAPKSFENLRPTMNGTAPRNTKLWFETFDRTAVLTLATAQGVAVPLERSVIALNAQSGGSVIVFKPTALLEANTTYVVTNTAGSFEAGRFTTTSEIDMTPPAALAVTVMGAVGVSAQSPSRLSLSLGAQPEFAVIGEEGQTWQPSIALNTSSTSTADLFAMPEGEKRLVVFNVDLAGNATPSEVISGTVPPPVRGCSVAGSAFPLALLGLALLRRRTR